MIITAMAFASLAASAQKPMVPPAGGKSISDQLLGIFIEDISYACDGGLNAQLVQNGSFEYNLTEQPGWGAGTAWRYVTYGHSTGNVNACSQAPLNENNPNYMRLYVERVGHFSDFRGTTGVGISNSGFGGMVLKAGEKYDFSVFLRSADGKARDMEVSLMARRQVEGRPFAMPVTVGKAEFKTCGRGWQKYEVTLTATEDCTDASLQLLCLTEGSIDIDMVSLIPQDTFKGHGLRRDLAEAIDELNPKFVRFPGGCVVHGGGQGFWNTYRWKESVGPKEARKQQMNTWGYHQSLEIGYYEYFQFCEDIGAKPVPILPLGLSCQGAGGSWNLKGYAQMAVPMEDMEEWVADALDLIEWANGGTDTKWGAIRAAQGHPEPFNLEMIGIGNEEYISPEFRERFKYMFDRISEAHPEITIIGTAGVNSHPDNKDDYVQSWKIADELGLDIIDEHYYEPKDFYLSTRQYDSYPRDRKTKVYLGEYASKDYTLLDALAEALYLCHVERNGDVVVMTSYAPLLQHREHSNWTPDLILFDNTDVVRTCSYYVQKIFGNSEGSLHYGDLVKIDGADLLQEQSAVLNPQKRELYIKLCNASAESRTAHIDIKRFKGVKGAEITTLKGDPGHRNDFGSEVLEPQTEAFGIKPVMDFEMEPYSFSMITVKF